MSRAGKGIILPLGDDRHLKMLYLAMMDITKKWTYCQRIGGIHNQLEVYFADQLPP